MQLHFPQSAYILGESFICIFIVAQLFCVDFLGTPDQ